MARMQNPTWVLRVLGAKQMWPALFLGAIVSAADAGTVQPSVVGVGDARAVNVLFGEDGQTVSTCSKASGGWSCSPVDIHSSTPVYLMVDTRVVDMGVVSQEGPDMSIEGGIENPTIEWRRSVEPGESRRNSVVIVRVRGAEAAQAPMLHLAAGELKTEVGCADDGRFPDGISNDGLFHCASVLQTSTLASEEWTLVVSMRTSDGDVDNLGTFPFSDETGLLVVSVGVGEAASASTEFFALVGPKVQSPDPSSMNEDGSQQAPIPPEEAVPQAAPKLFSGWVWAAVLGALGLGWLIGSRSPRGSKRRDQAVALPVRSLDDRGPVPNGECVLISSAVPSQTLLHVAKRLTSLRRVLILGEVDCTALDPIHPIHIVTDRDRFAVQELVEELCGDGGVPPVLLILGSQSVLDTGGASPSPTRSLIESIEAHCWCALFVAEDETPVAEYARWGYDPQAGWAKL